MTKPVKTITSVYTRGQALKPPHEGLPTLDKLISDSQHLRKLSLNIGEAPFAKLASIEGDLKARFILQRFVQYHDDFENSNDFFIYAFTCGKYLVKKDEAGKEVEAFPVDLRSRDSSRERKARLEVTRKIAREFRGLGLSPEQCKLFVDEIAPYVLPVLFRHSFNASSMLREAFVIEMIGKMGFERFRDRLQKAAGSNPADLAQEITRLTTIKT